MRGAMACCWISTMSICEFLKLCGGRGKERFVKLFFLRRGGRHIHVYVYLTIKN